MRPRYEMAAKSFGQLLARHRIGLVYGGAQVGLMGALADGVLSQGGEVIGVIPRALVEREIAHHELSDLYVVEDMHERKALMAELSDGFVALPGGAGTLEELFEAWTWGQLGLHEKPCGLLDVGQYFAPLQHFLDHVMREGFLRAEDRHMLIVESDPEALLERFERYTAPRTAKWKLPQGVERSGTESTCIDVLAWVCVRGGRMLATRTRGNTVFYVPGGKRRTGESDWQALAREVSEELGLALDMGTVTLFAIVQAPAHGQPKGTHVRMTCYAAEALDDISALSGRAEVEEVAWLGYCDRTRCAPAAARLLGRLHVLGQVE